MLKLSSLLVLSLLLVGSIGHAMDKRMTFRFVSYGAHHYEVSSTWNSNTQESTIRMALIPVSIDGELIDKSLSFRDVNEVSFYLLDSPDVSESCQEVTGWNFEYTPDLPSLVMYLILRGAGCKKVGENLDLYLSRIRFQGLALRPGVSIDLAVEVSR